MPGQLRVRQSHQVQNATLVQMAEQLEKDLEDANAIAEAQMLRPNSDEVAAIKDYCSLVLEKRTLESNSKEEWKPIRDKITEAKKALLEMMKT